MESTGNVEFCVLRPWKILRPKRLRGGDQLIAFIILRPEEQPAASRVITADEVQEGIDLPVKELLLLVPCARHLGNSCDLDEHAPTPGRGQRKVAMLGSSGRRLELDGAAVCKAAPGCFNLQ
jgi:hypothetical protein